MEDTPLISIVTPLYNAANFIAETILSVQNQTYLNWEHIIVDDASTDNSMQIVEGLANHDTRIKLVKSSINKGAAVCRNVATEHAKGDYIAFLDSDDLWHPEKLQKQLQFMLVENGTVSYTNYRHIDEDGALLNKRIKALTSLSYKKQHRNNYIGNLTGIYNANALGKIVAPNIRKRQDWAVWLEAIKRSEEPALGLQEDLAYYRVRKGSISANKWGLVKYNYAFYRTHLKYPVLKSLYCLGLFFMEYFFIRPKYIQHLS